MLKKEYEKRGVQFILGAKVTSIKDGKITILSNSEGIEAAEYIDATGKYVCPGFIDAHGHSDISLLADPAAKSKRPSMRRCWAPCWWR